MLQIIISRNIIQKTPKVKNMALFQRFCQKKLKKTIDIYVLAPQNSYRNYQYMKDLANPLSRACYNHSLKENNKILKKIHEKSCHAAQGMDICFESTEDAPQDGQDNKTAIDMDNAVEDKPKGWYQNFFWFWDKNNPDVDMKKEFTKQ